MPLYSISFIDKKNGEQKDTVCPASALEATIYEAQIFRVCCRIAHKQNLPAKGEGVFLLCSCGVPQLTPQPLRSCFSSPKKARPVNRAGSKAFSSYSAGLNWSLPTPQTGQVQSAGKSSNFVPAAMPCSGSPVAGS